MTLRTTTTARAFRYALGLLLAFAMSAVTVEAQRARGNVRSGARSTVHSGNVNVNRNANVNRNVNVDRNVNRNIDVDRDIDVDVDRPGGCCYRGGWGAAAAVATTAVVTAAVVGSVANSLPPSCSIVVVNGFTYQQCGSVWYQPQLAGSSTTYVVVNAPR
jgi:hypothetical protein